MDVKFPYSWIVGVFSLMCIATPVPSAADLVWPNDSPAQEGRTIESESHGDPRPGELDVESEEAARRGAVLPAENIRRSMVVDGLKRTYILHLPLRRVRREIPLLLVLHGGKGTGRRMQIGVGFDRYADRRAFAVAYPDAYEGLQWNDGRGVFKEPTQSVNDVKFLTELVDDAARVSPIRRAEVYVTGASNGGMMAYRLACETKGVFAGFAPVIANLPVPLDAACVAPHPAKFLTVNGDADRLVPLGGGELCDDLVLKVCRGQVESNEASLAPFILANGCSREITTVRPPLVRDGTKVIETDFSGCISGKAVKRIIIKNGGHTWPPVPSPLWFTGISSRNLSATEEVVRFFFGAAL